MDVCAYDTYAIVDAKLYNSLYCVILHGTLYPQYIHYIYVRTISDPLLLHTS